MSDAYFLASLGQNAKFKTAINSIRNDRFASARSAKFGPRSFDRCWFWMLFGILFSSLTFLAAWAASVNSASSTDLVRFVRLTDVKGLAGSACSTCSPGHESLKLSSVFFDIINHFDDISIIIRQHNLRPTCYESELLLSLNRLPLFLLAEVFIAGTICSNNTWRITTAQNTKHRDKHAMNVLLPVPKGLVTTSINLFLLSSWFYPRLFR